MPSFTNKKKNRNEPIQIAEVHDIVAFQHNLESYSQDEILRKRPRKQI